MRRTSRTFGGTEGVFVQKGNKSLPQSAEVGAEEKGSIRRSVAPRTDSDAGGGYARDDARPPRSAVLRHARTFGEADADRANGFRYA
ncbi:hypothetical protein [Paenibacillus phytorum]|uniref:hypothetical protein n=1 Tax=Paenibacillus phytorum TaxID=2654977 RepID=UPI0035E427FB